MKKHVFRISVILLVVVLAIVSFYMLYVHVPYYNYHHGLDEIRNEICEEHNYEYMDYFNEYRGQQVYYVMKVKINDVLSYVVYDQDKKLIDTYQGEVALEKSVQKAVQEKYKVNIDKLEIAYENERFVYYAKYQTKETLLYVYYNLQNGEFMKAVKFEE